MTDVISVKMDNKVLTNSKVIGYLDDLTKGAHLESFYKASSELAPLLANCKPETIFQVEYPFGVYKSTAKDISETVIQVIETRERNQEHYDAITKANLILSTLDCFTLDGIKPESKRGKPKQELAFE